MFHIWSFFTTHSRFSMILIVGILIFGFASVVAIPKESAPQVAVPIAIVTTVLPGASPEDVEALVTNVLEEPLKSGLNNLRKITSSSGGGVSIITVEFQASADLTKSMRDVRDTVDAHKGELPKDALDPRVVEIDFSSDPVITATLSGSIPRELLYRLSDRATDELKTIKGVSSVTVSGVESNEVNVIINKEALSQRNLTVLDVTRAIRNANVSVPVGNIQVKGVDFPVRLTGDISKSSQVANIPIVALGGAPVYIRDIAHVVDGRSKPTTLSRTSVGGSVVQQSVTFDIFKSSSSKITKVSTAIQESLSKMTASGGILDGMNVTIVYNNGKKLQDDLTTLTRSGIQTVLLVTFVLLLAVGWREALIAAVSIPLSFLTAFIGLYYSGNTLNFVSLFALILSIGIIVDSTIVIVEGINRRLHELLRSNGESQTQRHDIKENAALDVVREFHIPLTTGTLTTVAVFAPLFIVSGITGEFIKSIPFTIIFILIASLLVALGFVPLFATHLLRRGHTAVGVLSKHRDAFITFVENHYRKYLRDILTHKESENILIYTLITLFIISLTLPALGAVRVVFFEDSNSDNAVVEVKLPVGSTLSRTSLEMQKAEETLYTVPEIESFASTVGRGSSFSNPFAGASGGARFGNIFITLNKNRKRTTIEIVDEVRKKLSAITTSTISINQLSDGPPSLAPITITLYSDSLKDLDKAARTVEVALKDSAGSSNVVSSVKDTTNEFVFSINRAQVVSFGADITTIAESLRIALQGSTATTIQKLGKDIDVIVRIAPSERNDTALLDTNATTINALSQIKVATAKGNLPLSTFVSISVAPSRATINHEDGTRIATISSHLVKGGNAIEVEKIVKNKLSTTTLPSSVHISYGGENEDINQSFTDMFKALLIGLVSMFAILVLQFNSFRYALYVLAIVPLSLIGVFIGLMITGSPLSFPSIMGFIALSGIVVNNAIILIDTINIQRRKYGASKTMQDIVIDASTSRLRPVLLTALTTVIGVIPLLFAAAIWVPLAYALMFGLSFATVITLFLVPSIYARWPGKMEV